MTPQPAPEVTRAKGDAAMADNKKYFDYLEELRESGAVNMSGAVPYLQRQFPELGFDINRARSILLEWMEANR